MIRKFIYIATGTLCFTLSFNHSGLVKYLPDMDKIPSVPVVKALFKAPPAVLVTKSEPERVSVDPAKLDVKNMVKTKITTSSNLSLKKVDFDELPGWDDADVKKSLSAFQQSCQTFLKQKPTRSVGSANIRLHAGDWHPACEAALSMKSTEEPDARRFFEKWFHPVELKPKSKTKGLFTGYYMPQLKGSLQRTPQFTTPVYGLPGNSRVHYTREQIDKGALDKKAPVIAWIRSPAERLFLEIEGAGVIKLATGKSLYLSYAGENGAPYTSIGSVLIRQGIMTRHTASKTAIIRYLEEHPGKMNSVLHQNKSFVFFQTTNGHKALGAQDMALTPGYSLAIDKRWIPLGAPLWLNTKSPVKKTNSEKTFQRLMIAQDTGGAIRGLMRGDVYWGSGTRASFLGEHMKNTGSYWLLLPKYAFARFGSRIRG